MQEKETGKLYVELLGPPRFLVGGKEAALRFRKSKALLMYLAVNAGRKVTRQRLTELLWEDADTYNARQSLRQTWFGVKSALEDLGFESFESDRDFIQLSEDGVTTDLQHYCRSIDSGVIPEPLLSRTGLGDRLGDGLEQLGENFFAWIRTERQIATSRLQNTLEVLLSTSPRNAPIHVEAAKALFSQDATNEPACRALIVNRASQGDMSGAVEIYNRLWHVLDQEFDAEPSLETQSLIERVKLDRMSAENIPPMVTAALPVETGVAASTEYLERGPVIVVMPFETFDENDSESRRTASALRHDLIARLIRFREWSVLDTLPEEAGEKCNSLFELSGRIDLIGDDLQATINLKDLETDRFVWSEFIEANRSDILDRQANLVGRIALAMNVHVSAERLSRLKIEADVTLDLYDRLLRGQEIHFRWRPEESDSAATLFRNLIDEKPLFSPAYSSLAQIINSRHIMFPGEFRKPDHLNFAAHLGRTALRLDPLDSRAHLCTGWSHALAERFDEAIESFRTAYRLNENDPWTSVSAAAGLGLCGDHAMSRNMAIRSLDMGLVASPLQWSYQVAIWFACEDYERAVEAATRADGGFFGVEAWNLAALVHLGETGEARRLYVTLLDRIRSTWFGRVEPTVPLMEKWLLQCYPIGDPRTRELFGSGLRAAGMSAHL